MHAEKQGLTADKNSEQMGRQCAEMQPTSKPISAVPLFQLSGGAPSRLSQADSDATSKWANDSPPMSLLPPATASISPGTIMLHCRPCRR